MIASELLHAFAVFAEDANLSRAARRLHLSQPAVHAQIKRLEASLGVALYRRVGRGLALTRDGVEVAAFARDEAERSAELVRRLRGEGAPGRLVLATGAGALLHVISSGLRAFARTYEGRLEIVTAARDEAIEATRSGAAHVGVAAMDAPPEGLDARRLVEAPQVLVMPRTHRLASRRRCQLSDLEGERMVLPPPGRPQRVVLDAAFASQGVTVHTSATATGWDVVLRLVELGAGVAVVNGTVPVPRGLVARPVPALPKVRYFALTRPSAHRDASVLVEALAAHATKPPL